MLIQIRPTASRFHRRLAAVFLGFALLITDTSAIGVDENFQSPELANVEVPQRLLVLPDDSFLTYWSFNRFNGQNAGLILKFKADGTLDPSFRFTGPYFHVIALTPAPGGQFIVAVRRQGKTNATYPILRLNADGSVDESFDAGAGADRDVYSLAVQPDGKILVGGTFDSFNGQSRQAILRLQANGAIDSSFASATFTADQTTGATGIRTKIIVQPDGRILFGGNFSGVNSQSRDGIARLNTDGSLDQTFVPTPFRTGTGGHRPIGAVELEADGRILAAGRFAPPGSNVVTPLVRLSSEGAINGFFPARPNQTGTGGRPLGQALKLLSNGDIIVAGDRLYLYSAALAERPGSQTVTIGGSAFGLDTISDGRILLAGDRNFVNGAVVGVQRFSPDAVRDTNFNVGEFQREVLPHYVAPRSDGEIWLAASLMRRVNGVRRDGIARLNIDGTLDGAQPNTGIGTPVAGISLQPDDRYVLSTINFYRRFTVGDVVDPNFANDTTLVPFTAVQPAPGGKHFVLSYGGSAVLLDTVLRQVRDDGFVDPSFQIGVKFSDAATSDDRYVVYVGSNTPMANYADGRFLFRYFDKTGNYRLGRFNANGSVDSTFQTASVPALVKSESWATLSDDSQHLIIEAAPTALTDVLLLGDGKVVVVGMFKGFNGVAAPGIVRLREDGTVDQSFNPGSGAGWLTTVATATQLPRVDAVEQLTDGKLLLTGDFEAFDGVPAPGIVRLNPDGSRDSSFVSPVSRQSESTALSDDMFAFSPFSRLTPEPGGTLLLSGNYKLNSGGAARSLIRLTGLTDVATRLLNISTRVNVQTGENVLIGGFIITGNAPKKVIVRALGTSLAQSGISGALADPTLELLGPDGVIAGNDNWKESQRGEIEASDVPPQSDLESAIVRTLAPGAYTAVVRGNNGGTGVGLVELYDLEQAVDSKLANISTRGFVQTGENVMIGGFILGGGTSSTNVLVRALGPSLSDSGVTGALQDPTLELRDNNGSLVAENDDWRSTQQAAIEGTTIPPKRDAEAAILAPLQPGAYTAVVRGKNNTIGVGLVEVYNVQ